ncbi:SRPBCC family protein [Pseudomonas sp. NPDC007930]|uniref:aromatic ring-hydroxylating oxygenase subunit alpha n=1 Tax=Pseudomonas sp. NPDC007930 TaxID=3364417 RepID=UPI0036E06AB9
MQHLDTTRDLAHARQPQHALPRRMYSDEQVYQADLELFWYREWIFAGHTVALEKPGSYFTLQLGDYPIVVIKGEKGEIHAHHNACRHRGAKLCSKDKGRTPKLVCPYHKWTYNPDGALIYAGNMGETFDKSRFNLNPVHVSVIDTYIYVCVAPTPPAIEPFREALLPYVLPHNLSQCKVAHESHLVEKGNWKLVFENNRECYHCEGSHPELLHSYVENLSVAGVNAEDPALASHWQRCEAEGFPSQLLMDPHGQYRITRIPLAHGASSYTLDGQPAVRERLANPGGNLGALLFFNYPSTWNHLLGDHVLSFRVLPISATETLVTTHWLVHKDAVEGVDYQLDNLTKVWVATNDQDRELVEATQAGLRSPSYQPGPYSPVAEGGVCQFDDWYTDALKARLAR